MTIKSLAAVAVLASFAAAAPALADCTLPPEAAPGKTVSGVCKACHIFEADKPSRPTGPNLHDVYGSPAGSRADFKSYSEGMQGAKAKGTVWTDDNLFDYIGDPKGFLDKVNGAEVKHAMLFALKDDQKRKDMIAFLKAIKGKAECN
jgi:cytochrome c